MPARPAGPDGPHLMGQWEWIIILLIVVALGGYELIKIRRAVRQDKENARKEN